MMVMTAKVNLKRILLGLAAVAVGILALVWLLGGSEVTQTGAPAVSGNDGRVDFLKSFGWEVTSAPVESGQVRIPQQTSQMFERYNNLQKSQGYDLSAYAGKKVMRYVYEVTNYPGATEAVYATVLVYKDQVIGGDITNTTGHGRMQGFPMPTETDGTSTTVEKPEQ